MTSALPTIGVLGGMGPAATADFYGKLVAATPAERDQDHLPVLIHSVPQIPDRAAAFLHGEPSPEPMLVDIAQQLERSGASLIVMPCNTAHLWHGPVAAAVKVPVLHIVDPVLAALRQAASAERPLRVGLLGTAATVQSRLYPGRSKTDDVQWLVPDDDEQAEWVSSGIEAVKAGQMAQARLLLSLAARALVGRGARALVYACTEVPLVLSAVDFGVPALDATQLLADATVAWARAGVERARPWAAGRRG